MLLIFIINGFGIKTIITCNIFQVSGIAWFEKWKCLVIYVYHRILAPSLIYPGSHILSIPEGFWNKNQNSLSNDFALEI
jgi:hypothetical protein